MGTSRGPPGSHAHLGRLKKSLGVRSGRPLGGGLGGLLVRLESQVGSKLGLKREVFGSPETKRKWMHYWEPLGVDIFMNFGGY